MAMNTETLAEWVQRRDERATELRKTMKVGSRVSVSAQFTGGGSGIVEEITSTGIRIGKLWFGWHEIASVDEP